MKPMMEQLGKSEHAFDIDAMPEPVPVECGAGDADAGIADDDVDDDGFGPVGDDDGYNDDDCDKGLQTVETVPIDASNTW